MTKKHVNVVMGGPSAEHEISLRTGREVLRNLDKSKYLPRAVVITKSREIYWADVERDVPTEQDCIDPSASKEFKGPLNPAASFEIWKDCDVAFLALHGEFGVFQGFLETLGVPYTGSGVLASAMGMDKIVAKHVFEQNGITTPPYSIYHTDGSGTSIAQIATDRGFPSFVKCPQSGSSRLMGRATNTTSLEALCAEFASEASEILVESAIHGDEYSVPVLEYPDGSLKALPPILIRLVKTEFFDYTAKYMAGASEEIVPAPCSAELTARLQDVAVRAHRAIGCKGLTRTDIIVQNDTLFALEINTLPGMTSASLAPKAFAAAGGSFAELLDILLRDALSGGEK